MAIPSRTRLGRYEVHSRIAAGGMGEVYLAHDTQLERTVALKILPADVASDRQRMRRFIQEAKATAALHHPNIAHIYEIGETEGTNFIAMEFIEGETLGEKIHHKVDLKKLLEYLTQVTEGLAKAHASGIVHRDLKPDNIMVTHDGYAKVLDFGLAKLLEMPEPQSINQEGLSKAPTVMLPQHSQPGTVMGTVGYMSPEQAQGKTGEIDHRSDIFSFGCVLYEVVTSHRPFDGASTVETLHKIVYESAPPIKDFNPTAPADLQRIVRRCLAKDPDERYQTIKDLAIELKEVRREMDGWLGQESLTTQASSSGAVKSGSEQADTKGISELASPTAEAVRPPSSAEYLVSEIRSHKTGAAIALAVLVIALGGVSFGLYKLIHPGKPVAAPFQTMKITRLTSTGNVTGAAISPDGKYVVYVVRSGDGVSLWIRQVATTSNMQIVPPARVKYSALTFSREGNFVYYLSTRQEQTLVEGGDLYQIAVLGGASRKLLEDLDSPIGFSPDGKQFAFIRNRPGESALMVANADGSGERTIAIRKSLSSFGDLLDGGVAWSPDGKVIATIAREANTRMNVVEIPSGGGAEKPITSQSWYEITRLAWLADGSGLIMTAADALPSALSAQVWLLSYPSGDAQRITNDLNGYIGASLTSDSGVLATVQGNRTSNIWIVPNGGAGQATQITYGAANLAGLAGVAWTPDGRIVYHSTASGAHGIWIMGADGTGQRQLTIGANAGYPAVCPDNRYIVFVSEGAGRAIWKMDLDGSHPKQLAQGGFPQCTPDSRWVVYQSGESLWKVPIDGGEPVQLTSPGFAWPAISPDGKWIAAQQFIQIDNPISARIAIVPIEGGEPIKVFDVSVEMPALIRWSPDGRAVTYLSRRDGVVNVWSQPFEGGPSRQLTDFKSDDIFFFDWSRDGRQLLLARGTWSRDVILISSFR